LAVLFGKPEFSDKKFKKGAVMSNFLVMAWMLSLGFIPNSSLEINGGAINASNCLVQTLGVGFYIADFVHIYSTVEIQETKSQGVYFDPFRGDFLIGGALYFKNLSIGVSHECNHDIVTNTDCHDYNGWEANFDKAYINYLLPIRIGSVVTVTPSITLANQFTERTRIKSNNEKEYFKHNKVQISPNIFFPEFRLEIEIPHLRSHVAFQTGYMLHNGKKAYTQFKAGAEVFYKHIALGIDYVNRENILANAGYAWEGLTLFIRFGQKSSLL
jgi:predicted outer membrane repeat protein